MGLDPLLKMFRFLAYTPLQFSIKVPLKIFLRVYLMNTHIDMKSKMAIYKN